MARCKECFHYAVCAKESRLVQIDEHTWDDYNQLDDVERLCDNYVSNTNVAPPIDIERLSAIIWKLKQENLLPVHSMIENARLEVAREIFEELCGLVMSKTPVIVSPIFKDDLDFDCGFINGKRDAFIEVLMIIAELKKKYTNN